MAENSENIEARLCAYVEGDLDEVGRVEIERHLEAHPNHRRLISELMATRDLLRYLPREQAPPELAETFNAQLERSALLDAPVGEPAGQVLRGNFLPRLLAMAAIVVLGSGLFAIVYFSLLPSQSNTHLAMPTVTPSTNPYEESLLATSDQDSRDRVAARTERLGKGGPPVGDVSSKLLVRSGGKSGLSGADPVYVLVSADRVEAAVKEVTGNLYSNNIVFETVTDQAPPPLRLQQYQVANARNNTAVLELSNALQKKQFYEQKQQQQVQVPAQPSQSDAFTYAAKDVKSKGQVAVGESENAAPSAVASDDKAADAAALTEAPIDAAVVAHAPQSQPQIAQNQQEQEYQADQPAAADSEVVAINAYGVTRKQVEELGRALNRESQRVELIADDEQIQLANAGLQRMLENRGLATASDVSGGAGRYLRDSETTSASQASESEQAVAQAPAPATPLATAAPADAAEARAANRDSVVALKGESNRLADAPSRGKEGDVNSKVAARGGTGPRPPVIRSGNELYVTVDELKGPDTEPTTQARVGDDGTIRLPQLQEPLRVEGLSREEAARAIADAYKRSGVIDAPTVTVDPVADTGIAGQSAQPVQQQAQRRQPARSDEPLAAAVDAARQGQQATTSSGAGQSAVVPRARATTMTAATSPTDVQGQAELDLEERVDVVILVQRNTVLPADAIDAPGVNASQQAESRPATSAPDAAASEPPAEQAPPAENAK